MSGHRLAPVRILHAVVLSPGELERRLRAAGVGVTVLDESQLSAWRILRGIRAVVRDFRPDAIHTHREKENVLGGLAARLAGSAAMRSATGNRPRWRCPTNSVSEHPKLPERYNIRRCAALYRELYEGSE